MTERKDGEEGLHEERMWMLWWVCAWLDFSCRWGWTHKGGVFLWAYWFKIATHTLTRGCRGILVRMDAVLI